MNYAIKSKAVAAGVALSLTLLLSACDDKSTGVSSDKSTGVSSDKSTANEKETAIAHLTAANVANFPKYLPKDFPLPTDPDITLSNSSEDEGKKSVFLIVKSTQDIKEITQLYKRYFDSRGLSNDAHLIDGKNLIMQGDSAQHKESWSIIGGELSNTDGVVELIINWEEL